MNERMRYEQHTVVVVTAYQQTVVTGEAIDAQSVLDGLPALVDPAVIGRSQLMPQPGWPPAAGMVIDPASQHPALPAGPERGDQDWFAGDEYGYDIVDNVVVPRN